MVTPTIAYFIFSKSVRILNTEGKNNNITYVMGDVLPIIQNIDRLIAKASSPVRDTSA